MWRLLNRTLLGPAVAIQLPPALVTSLAFLEHPQSSSSVLLSSSSYQTIKHQLSQQQLRLLLPLSERFFMSFSALYQSLTAGPAAETSGDQDQEGTKLGVMIAKITASHEEAMLLEEPASTTAVDAQGLNTALSTDNDNLVGSKSRPEAITVEGVTLEASTTISSVTNDDEPILLFRNGHGVRTVRAPFGYNIHVYVVSLYTSVDIKTEQDVEDLLFSTTDKSNGAKSFVMDFTFLRDVTPSQMSIAWNYQLDTSVTASDYEDYPQDRSAFLELLGDGPMKANGVIRFEFFPQQQHQGDDSNPPKMVLFNQGKRVGEIEGTNFQRAFASMWFGDKPVMEEIKAGLLLQGDDCVSEQKVLQSASEVIESEVIVSEPLKVQG